MSDFLSDLAATALHVMPIAQPRTPAIFEPRAIPASEPALESSASLESSIAVPRILSPQIETHVEQHTTRDLLNTNVRSTSQRTSEITARIEEQSPRAEWQPSTIVTPRLTPSITRMPQPPIEPASREEQSEHSEGAPRGHADTSTHVSIAPLISRTTLIEPRVTGEPIEPRIHVSIGRIEVRATTPTASTRAAKREAPILGLDDYLRQRR
jgi:hypothetical protein